MRTPNRTNVRRGDRVRSRTESAIVYRISAIGIDENDQTLVRLSREDKLEGLSRIRMKWMTAEHLFRQYEGIPQQ